MMRTYEFGETNKVGKEATRDIEKFLKKLPETIEVQNVEDNEVYRRKDIDLIWNCCINNVVKRIRIEVKGDRQYKTGNYFFETYSNREKGTLGCFMYTEADLLFYYFVETQELHILPVKETRDWFIPRLDRFKERCTTTPIKGRHYTTVGCLVPRNEAQAAVPTIEIVSLKSNVNPKLPEFLLTY